MNCVFCNRECKNDNSLRNHQRLCKLNPDKQTTPFQNQEMQRRITEVKNATGVKNQWSNPEYKITDQTRQKISWAAKNRTQSEETKTKRRVTIAEKVKRGEWHTSLAKDHHYTYNGVDLHGKWEYEYAKWLDENKIKWERCRESFEYKFEGKMRRYTPDFYLIETDEYIEIKGYKTEKDEAKWSQFPKYRTLKVLLKDDLKKIGLI